MKLCTFDQSLTHLPMLNRDPRIVMLSQSDRDLWCEIACAICTTSATILHTSPSLHLARMELHMVEKVHTCGRLHRVEHGVRATIKEMKSSLLPGKDKVVHYHWGRRRLWAGEHYLQQRWSFSNLLRMSVLQTCSRNMGEGGVLGDRAST